MQDSYQNFEVLTKHLPIQNCDSGSQKATSDFVKKFDLFKNGSSTNKQYNVCAPTVAVNSIFQQSQLSNIRLKSKDLLPSVDTLDVKEDIKQIVDQSELSNKYHSSVMASLANSSNLTNPWTQNQNKSGTTYLAKNHHKYNIDHRNLLSKRRPDESLNTEQPQSNMSVSHQTKQIKTDNIQTDNLEAIFKNLEEVCLKVNLKNISE